MLYTYLSFGPTLGTHCDHCQAWTRLLFKLVHLKWAQSQRQPVLHRPVRVHSLETLKSQLRITDVCVCVCVCVMLGLTRYEATHLRYRQTHKYVWFLKDEVTFWGNSFLICHQITTNSQHHRRTPRINVLLRISPGVRTSFCRVKPWNPDPIFTINGTSRSITGRILIGSPG